MISVVVGGQFGSESKAKAAVQLAKCPSGAWRVNVVGVRCGGPNAGHTVWVGDNRVILRLVPSLAVNPWATLCIAGGALIDEKLLISEIEALDELGLNVRSRLFIDPEIALVDGSAIEMEQTMGMGKNFGSTETGTGGATSLRALRKCRTARDSKALAKFVSNSGFPIWKLLADHRKRGHEIIIEGTQGYGLSLFHAGYYPFCTSKAATAAQFITEAGVPPRRVGRIVVVVRTYPIRVGGNSGPLSGEVSWEYIQQESGADHELTERTSVTKKVRRVGTFDMSMVKDAVEINGATELAVHGLDYINASDYGVREWDKLSQRSKAWVQNLEAAIEIPVTMAFTGKHQDDIVIPPRPNQIYSPKAI